MWPRPVNVNALVYALQMLRTVGREELTAVGVVNGEPVRFAVIAINRGEGEELVLELERRSA